MEELLAIADEIDVIATWSTGPRRRKVMALAERLRSHAQPGNPAGSDVPDPLAPPTPTSLAPPAF